ncbi:ARM REPEAT PROTEIN INTERACTING WITH ABF2 [Striga hermonthica]|uniref:ARM REPEAT PROTEIN INTERACTING WITH ABF2 n=1 Tax=Striga hermonthica TaxID=68872 RepID=A0A9N7NL86_STRHE|nr:ARM REPEAT PROTEIN INTERACTING WITH ABF2 [Striga hermonthica]
MYLNWLISPQNRARKADKFPKIPHALSLTLIPRCNPIFSLLLPSLVFLMENQSDISGRRRHEKPSPSPSRRSLKRKLDEDPDGDRPHRDPALEVRAQVEILDSALSPSYKDRLAVKKAIDVLSCFARNEEMVDMIVGCAAVPALVRHLQAPRPVEEGDSGRVAYEHEVEKASAFTLGLLAIKPEHQHHIVDAGALPFLVDLLKRYRGVSESWAVLRHLLYLMRIGEKVVKSRVALTLAHLCSSDDHKIIFIDNNGLDLLLELLVSTNLKHQRDCSMALCRLADKANSLSLMDVAPPSPIPQVYLGEQFVNNPTLSDVTFLVEGKRFYAHRICLLASCDAFRAMFDGGYRERDAKDIEIPNIRWDIFELMMRYIYTGSVVVNLDIVQDLLMAADQYLLEGLKRLCEYAIAQNISVENVSLMFELSEAYNALSLRHACILFILQKFDSLCNLPWYPQLIQRVLPEIRNYFVRLLTRFYNNAYYARVGGVSTSEMNKLEKKFLFSLDFRLYVSVSTFGKYCSVFKREGSGGLIERPIKLCGVEESWTNKDDPAHAQSTAG